MPSLEWKTDLNHGPVLVVAGRFATTGGDVAVAAGSRVFLFVSDGGEYRAHAVYDAGEAVSGMAVFRRGFTTEGLLVCTPTGIWLLGLVRGAFSAILQFHPRPGTKIICVASGDLDADGRDEIVAATTLPDLIYAYRITGHRLSALRLEPAGIVKLPGTPHLLEVLPGSGQNPALVACERDGTWGMARYKLTGEGLFGGAVMEGHPPGVTALAAGNFGPGPGLQAAAGSAGGMIWLLGSGQKPEIITVTKSLGTEVNVLAAYGSQASRLMAGTPEGNVFVFNHPVQQKPDLEFSPVEGVSGLAALPGGRVAVGTALGSLQVWTLNTGDKTQRYIVKPGDTLINIAKRSGVSVEKMLSLNENVRNPEVLLPGQVLIIPTG